MSKALAANIDYSSLVGGTTLVDSMSRSVAALRTQRPALDASEVKAFADSLREMADEDILAEAEALYSRVLGDTPPPAEIADGLELTLPFGHDLYVRATFQIMSVLAVWTVLLVVGSAAAGIAGALMLTGALYATGAPTPATVWKASGKAYDRLYGKGNYSPPKQAPKKRNKDNGVW